MIENFLLMKMPECWRTLMHPPASYPPCQCPRPKLMSSADGQGQILPYLLIFFRDFWGYKIGPVCLCVSALMAEQFDVQFASLSVEPLLLPADLQASQCQKVYGAIIRTRRAQHGRAVNTQVFSLEIQRLTGCKTGCSAQNRNGVRMSRK